MSDVPVQVPSAVLFLIFAVLLLGSLLLFRSASPERRAADRSRPTGRLVRSEAQRAT
jgi:hypothetical protein